MRPFRRLHAAVLAMLLIATMCAAGCSGREQNHDANAFPVEHPNALGGPDTSDVSTTSLDVAYATQSQAQKMDVFLPASGSGPFPIIIAIHGGGFRYGDKADSQLVPMIEGLERGYAVASINYRLSDEARWPAAINDVKAAIRFLRANSATYGIDPERFAVWGDSAGGDLAALAGTSGGVEALADPAQGNATQSDRVQAVIDWFGPIDYEQLEAQYAASPRGDLNGPDSVQSQLFGRPLSAIPAEVRAANAATYISADDPPFLIEHGGADGVVPVEQSTDFAAKLTERLGADRVTLRVLPDAGHMDAVFVTPEHLDFVFDWLDARLK